MSLDKHLLFGVTEQYLNISIVVTNNNYKEWLHC